MNRRAGVRGGLACGLPLVLVTVSMAGDDGHAARHEYARGAMGTEFRIVLYAEDRGVADAAARAAFARVDDLDRLLSDYRPDSEVSELSSTSGSGTPFPLAPDTWLVLRESATLARGTEGAFDVTVGPLSKLWRHSARRGLPPHPERLREALEAVGWEALRLDPTDRTATPLLPGMSIDLGGIAKGYAVDEAFESLRAFGIERALVDGGGDIRAGAPPPGGAGWRIAVPWRGTADGLEWRAREIAHGAVATSGPGPRSFVADGVRYSHLVDPRTGRSVTTDRWVTVFAPTASRADGLASALSVLGEEGRPIALELGATETMVIEMAGSVPSPTEPTPGIEQEVPHGS